jgi:hypothetical protein
MPTALGPLHPEPVRSLPDITLESRYLQAGCINFLRKKDDIDERLGGGVIANGCFDHPVVILSTDLQGKTATVLIVSILHFLMLFSLS